MGKAKKAKTPLSEKLHAAQSLKNFRTGAAIKNRHGKATRGDIRDDPRSMQEAAAGGVNAVRQKAQFEKSRKQGKAVQAGSEFDVTQVQDIGESKKGGVDVSGGAGMVNRGANNVFRVGSIMSKMDSDKSIRKMEESNTKRQAAMDAAVGGIQAYALSKTKGNPVDPEANASQDPIDYDAESESIFDAPVYDSGLRTT